MDSGTISGFMEQLLKQPAILAYCVLFAILLVGSITAIIVTRNYRARKLAMAAPGASSPNPLTGAGYAPSVLAMDADLPDLDMLAPTPAAPAARPVRAGTYNVMLANGERVQAAEVMVILRDIDDGRLIVQLGDKSYAGLSDHPDAKQRFLKIMKELAQVVSAKAGETPDLPPAPAAPVPAKSDTRVTTNDLRNELASEEPANLGALVQPPREKPKAPPPPPPPAADGTMPGDLPKFRMEDLPIAPRRGIGLFGQRKEEQKKIEVPELNIASAIEAYIQHKLRYTTGFEGRSIHILPAGGGGVKIEVDGRYFDAVSDIDDISVRDFIAAAIQEWQDRQ